MPGGRLRSQLLITSRCLGWCGERGSERGSLPLNNLELNWMSRFLNQRTAAGFNSFSARQRAVLLFIPHRPRRISPAPTSVCITRPLGTRTPPECAAPPSSCTHAKREDSSPHPQPQLLSEAPSALGWVGSPYTEGVGILRKRAGTAQQQRVIYEAISISAALFSSRFSA